MSTIKCEVCGANCDASLSACGICGNLIAAVEKPLEQTVEPMSQEPSGFGQAPQTGFGQTPQTGFGQTGFSQAGFSQAPQTGFGQSGFGQAPQNGFGQAPQAGFGQAPQSRIGHHSGFVQVVGVVAQPAQGSGFPAAGFTPNTVSPGFDTVEPTPMGGFTADATKFAEDVNKQQDVIQWGFKECLIFLLKCLIPIYGVILIILCALGNPRKYPTLLTNMVRAELVLAVILMIFSIIMTLALGAGVVGAFL